VVPAVLEAYDFSGIGTLMDVAGGHGFVLCSILKRYPKMKGILLEMEHVAPGAEQRICDDQLQQRCKVVVGDFFKGVPEGADAIVMKHIIHDWDDARAIALLKNCHAALPKNGKVILLEAVVPEGDEPSFSKVLDLEMLAATGGLERTEKQYRKLFEDAGFRLTRVLETKSPLNVVEAVRS
jgi:cyclopropane fatty-acyl-phospholipid synthase-like methyltransferase